MTMLHSEAVTELPMTCASVTIPAQGWAEWDTQHVLLHPMYKDEMATKVLSCIELFRGTWKLLGEGFQQSYAWMGTLRQSRNMQLLLFPSVQGEQGMALRKLTSL